MELVFPRLQPSASLSQGHFFVAKTKQGVADMVSVLRSGVLRLEKGTVITVPRYGADRLEAVEDGRLIISFPQVGVRKFKKDIIKLAS